MEETIKTHFSGLQQVGDSISDYGKPTVERASLHESIIESFFVGSKSKGIAVVLMGGPAAGKTSIRSELPELDQFVLVDPDEVKIKIPEYMELVNQGDRSAAAVVHEESSYITALIRARAFEERSSMVVDAVGADYEKLSGIVQKLVDTGYDISVILVDVAFEVAQYRAQVRQRRVPFEQLKRAYLCNRLRKNLQRLWSEFSGLLCLVFDANTTPPRLVIQRIGGQADILDEDYYFIFVQGHCPEAWNF